VLGLATVIVAGIIFIYSGIYDIAATEPHNPVARWALSTTMQRSVTAHAAEVEVPATFTKEQFRRGLEHFEETCATCHRGPGVASSEVGRGLRPEPPDLATAVPEWSPAELFWIVKHGIKMSGMPGFGPTHGDEDLWAVVAFLGRLPTLSVKRRLKLTPVSACKTSTPKHSQCRILSISRSSIYYAPKGESPENLALMRRIDELFLRYPFYGSRQMARQVRREGVRVGRHRVRRLMRLMGLEAIYRAPKTSVPHPEHRVYPYLLRGPPGSARFPVSGRHHGLGDAPRAVVATVEHTGCGLLHRSTEGGDGSIREAGNLQHRSREPVHRLRVHGTAQGCKGHHLNGRSRPLHGQHLNRAVVALAQIRGGLPARTHRRLQGRARHRRLDQLLQRRTASLRAGRPDTGGSLRGGAACGYDGQGSRLAHIPTGSAASAGHDKQESGGMISQRNTP